MELRMPFSDPPQDDLAKVLAVMLIQIGFVRIRPPVSRERPENVVTGVVEKQSGMKFLGRVGTADFGRGVTVLTMDHGGAEHEAAFRRRHRSHPIKDRSR